jgi:hypothetical protein
VLVLVLSSAGGAAAHGGEPVSATHLHGQTEHIRELLRRGYEQSDTMRRLIDRLATAPVYVSIVEGDCRPAHDRGLAGCTIYLGSAGGYQHVRVIVNLGRAGDAQLSLLGHELQHVCEIVAAGPITAAEYEKSLPRVAQHTGALRFETAEAMTAEQAVLRELRTFHRGSAVISR